MKRRIISLVLLAIVIITTVAVSGCAASEQTYEMPGAPAVAPAPATVTPTISQSKGGGYDAEDGASSNGASTAVDRVIIRNGNLSIVAEDVPMTRDRIAALAQGLGGWVVTSELHASDDDNVWGYITIRVPDERYDEVVSAIRDYAYEVRSEATNSQDVTEEYIDLNGRLENAKATEQQYLALLERATSVEETLKVYDYLKCIQDEIEQLTGRIQYIEESAAMSAIYVDIQPKRDTQLVDDSWKFSEVWRKAVLGLTTFWHWLVSAIVWIVVFAAIWGSITAAVIIIRRRRRKRRQAGS